MSERPSKQRRHDALRILSGAAKASETAICNILAKIKHEPNLLNDLGDAGSSRTRAQLRSISSDILAKVGKKVLLPRLAGNPVEIVVAPPHEILKLYVLEIPAYRSLMEQKIKVGDIWRLALYHDEITPGNPLRPDNRRKLSIVYCAWLDVGPNLSLIHI